MARSARVVLRVNLLRSMDGLIAGVRVQAPKIGAALFWLDRDDGRLAELRRYETKINAPRN